MTAERHTESRNCCVCGEELCYEEGFDDGPDCCADCRDGDLEDILDSILWNIP